MQYNFIPIYFLQSYTMKVKCSYGSFDSSHVEYWTLELLKLQEIHLKIYLPVFVEAWHVYFGHSFSNVSLKCVCLFIGAIRNWWNIPLKKLTTGHCYSKTALNMYKLSKSFSTLGKPRQPPFTECLSVTFMFDGSVFFCWNFRVLVL